MFLKKGIILAL
jgi:hypothetical protein